MADLWLRDTDREELIRDIVEAVVKELTPLFLNQTPRLVDRYTMAKLLGISAGSLDKLVRDQIIPSKLVGSRRLFEPASVIASLPEATS